MTLIIWFALAALPIFSHTIGLARSVAKASSLVTPRSIIRSSLPKLLFTASSSSFPSSSQSSSADSSCHQSTQWRNTVKLPITTLAPLHPSNHRAHTTRASHMDNNLPSMARTMRHRLRDRRRCSSRTATSKMAMATTNKASNRRSNSTSPSTTIGGRDCSSSLFSSVMSQSV